MTIHRLADEYRISAALLRGRIRELEAQSKDTQDEGQQHLLERRLRPLRIMYRETRDVARHLERYYARTAEKQEERNDAEGLV